MAFGSFSSPADFTAVFVFRCCCLPYLRACWFRFMFTHVRHSFASLIAFKKLAALNVPGCVIVRTFPTNAPNPLIFVSALAQIYCYGVVCLSVG